MAKALVASRYNFFFPLETDDGSVLAYNSMKNSLLRLDAALYGRLEDVLAGRASVDASDEGVVGRLAALGFVVPEDFDELEAIRRDNFRNRTSARSLTLTIQPTLSCNFACAYCFQEHPRAFMGRDVEAALVRFVESHTPELERFGVSWFGGEPLLAINTIERLSRAFLDSAEAHGFEYVPAHLITNGWGLTAKNCRRLRECHLGSIQVTLDGIGAEHDRRRPLSDGSGTFDRIVDNLSTARTLLPDARLSIRVNIDAANPDALQHVREHLRAHGLGEVSVTIGHVQEYTAASRVERGTLNGQRLYQLATAADETALQRGGSLLSYPSIRAKTFCQAQKTHAYVVSPTGALFKCWIEAGLDESRAVGHLLRDEVRNRKDQKEFASLYEDWDQTQDAECAQCKVLPICGGGCLWKGMQARGDMKRAAKMCSPYKFGDTLERAVKLKYRQHRSRSEPAAVGGGAAQAAEALSEAC